ncbi:MAG: tetratricopeptide repeat protein [Methanotrichaceae archaeon]
MFRTINELLSQIGKLNDAIKYFEKAIELNPLNAEAWTNKGTALKAIGQNIEADAAFAKAKELGYTG